MRRGQWTMSCHWFLHVKWKVILSCGWWLSNSKWLLIAAMRVFLQIESIQAFDMHPGKAISGNWHLSGTSMQWESTVVYCFRWGCLAQEWNYHDSLYSSGKTHFCVVTIQQPIGKTIIILEMHNFWPKHQQVLSLYRFFWLYTRDLFWGLLQPVLIIA